MLKAQELCFIILAFRNNVLKYSNSKTFYTDYSVFVFKYFVPYFKRNKTKFMINRKRRATRRAEMEPEAQRQENIFWLKEKLFKLHTEDKERLSAKRSDHLQPKLIIGW